MINDDEILHKSIPSSNKLKSRDPPLIERQKAFNNSDNMWLIKIFFKIKIEYILIFIINL